MNQKVKIKSSKLFALLLAVVLVFGSIAVAASAANTDPYVKVSSVVNAEVGAKSQSITVSLSPETTLTNAKLTLTGDAKKLDNVNVVANTDVEGSVAVSSKSGSVTIEVTSAANNSNADLVLATITFDFEEDTKGAIELTATAATGSAKDTDGNEIAAVINDKPWGVSFVEGEEGEVYSNMVGIGLKGAVKTSSKSAPAVDAKAELTLVALDGKEYEVELDISGAIHGNNVMTAEDFANYLDKNKTSLEKKFQTALNNTEIIYDDFDLDTDSVMLNGEDLKASEKYDEDAGEYVYTAILKQCEPTTATINVVFRSAMSEGLYHGSSIPDCPITMTVRAGKTIYTQSTVLTYVKQHFDLYEQRNGDLDMDNDGIDDITIDGYSLNQWVKDYSAEQYDLGDFVLDESVVAFNNAKISGSEKFSKDSAENVYTVYVDQVNVPKSVLMAAADAFGKIDYGQFADAYVLTINETIEAFQAFCDSLVNAEWPSAEDVEESEDEKDSSDSPKTGAFIGLGSALAVVAALSATAVAIVRKKED